MYLRVCVCVCVCAYMLEQRAGVSEALAGRAGSMFKTLAGLCGAPSNRTKINGRINQTSGLTTTGLFMLSEGGFFFQSLPLRASVRAFVCVSVCVSLCVYVCACVF